MRVAIMLAVAIFVRADLQQAAETAKLEIVGGSRDDVAYRFEQSLEGWALWNGGWETGIESSQAPKSGSGHLSPWC